MDTNDPAKWPSELELQQYRTINFSEEYLNAAANLSREDRGDLELDKNGNPSPADGDNFKEIWLGYKDYGIVEEEWFPYQPSFKPILKKDLDQSPGFNELIILGKAARYFKAAIMYSHKGEAKMGLSDKQILAITEQLDNNVPVEVGMQVQTTPITINWFGHNLFDDLIPGNGIKGHSVALVGYNSGPSLPSSGYFIFRNSIGAGWEEGGYGYLTFNYIRKHVHDAVVYDESPKFSSEALVIARKPQFFKRLPEMTIHDWNEIGKLIHPNSYVRQNIVG